MKRLGNGGEVGCVHAARPQSLHLSFLNLLSDWQLGYLAKNKACATKPLQYCGVSGNWPAHGI